jgi:hypothetical protein
MARNGTTRNREGVQIYLIHAAADVEDARHLRNEIFQQLHVQATLAEDIHAKSNSLASVKQKLQRADLVVVLLTPHSVKSSDVLEQLGGAWVLEKRIIPVVTTREVLNGLPQSVADTPLLVQVGAVLDDKASNKVIERIVHSIPSLLCQPRSLIDKALSHYPKRQPSMNSATTWGTVASNPAIPN